MFWWAFIADDVNTRILCCSLLQVYSSSYEGKLSSGPAAAARTSDVQCVAAAGSHSDPAERPHSRQLAALWAQLLHQRYSVQSHPAWTWGCNTSGTNPCEQDSMMKHIWKEIKLISCKKLTGDRPRWNWARAKRSCSGPLDIAKHKSVWGWQPVWKVASTCLSMLLTTN